MRELITVKTEVIGTAPGRSEGVFGSNITAQNGITDDGTA